MFYQQTHCFAMGGPAPSTFAENYTQTHEQTAISTTLHPPTFLERFPDDVCFNLKYTCLKNLFHHINNLFQNIKITMEDKSNGELVFFDNLLMRNHGKISLLE